MKEFITAVEEVATSPVLDKDGKPVLDADGKEVRAETPPEEKFVEFKLDNRVLRAYPPTEGQLAFMLASLGRGQTSDQRFASIINIMLESLRDEDKDYLESRLLTRDPAKRMKIKQVEEIFEYLTSEWFATPTQEPSVSASSEPSDSAN